MIKNLFIKLVNNEDDFTEEERTILNEFIKDDVVNEKEKKLELNSKYRVGTIKVQKTKLF